MKPTHDWWRGPEDDSEWWAISLTCHDDWVFQPKWEVVISWPRLPNEHVNMRLKARQFIGNWLAEQGAHEPVLGPNFLLIREEEIAVLFYMTFKR